MLLEPQSLDPAVGENRRGELFGVPRLEAINRNGRMVVREEGQHRQRFSDTGSGVQLMVPVDDEVREPGVGQRTSPRMSHLP